MRFLLLSVIVATIDLCSGQCVRAQDLAPRAYVISPVHANALTLSYSYSSGDVIFGSTFPVTGTTGQVNLMIPSYYHSLGLLGRSANLTASLPYTVAHFRGEVTGRDAKVNRSGLMDLVVRFAINIVGGPALDASEFSRWRQKTILGASIKLVIPVGQYDPTRLINPGTHRWAFKPELGLSRRWGHWLIDGYGAVWLFTANPEYLSRTAHSRDTNTQSQSPVGALEAHLSYDVKPRFWASLDGNYWYGGRTAVNGAQSRPTLQANSRVGVTCSVPVSSHQSLKFSYSRGARIRFGGDSQNVSAAWQYSWLGRPK